ncbi:MAG: hypothetical protein DLM54_01025 [Acidimicrobiales bacterium]|nr:MAG: hypothetical protein DLM54_01025 [Acidimicrobiales bacterium]
MRIRRLRSSVIIPAGLVGAVAVLGMILFAPPRVAAQAQTTSSSSPDLPAPAVRPYGPRTFSQPGSGAVIPGTGIPANAPGGQALTEGRRLFVGACSSCHGDRAAGTSQGPNLVGVGAATVDFWVSTGRMPLAYPTAQAVIKPPAFNRQQTLAIVDYVTSLGAGGPGIPGVNTSQASVSNGLSLFALNCAPCHTITGVGDALSSGLFAPTLLKATPLQIAEAMRTGPGNMPRFGPGNLSKQQVNDIVAYVATGVQHPMNRGGAGLGHIGPVTEGFVAILIGLGGLALVSYWVGDRAA